MFKALSMLFSTFHTRPLRQIKCVLNVHLSLPIKVNQMSGFLFILQMKMCSNILVLKETRRDSMECFWCHLEEIVIHHLLVYWAYKMAMLMNSSLINYTYRHSHILMTRSMPRCFEIHPVSIIHRSFVCVKWQTL